MIKKIVPSVSLILVLLVASLVGGCGSDSSGGSEDFQFEDTSATHIDGSAVTDEEMQQWADNWCDLDGSMTRDNVIAIMGEPTSEYDATEGTPQSQYDRGEWNYTVFYGSDGYVDQLYINSLQIPKDEVADVGCPLVRHVD